MTRTTHRIAFLFLALLTLLAIAPQASAWQIVGDSVSQGTFEIYCVPNSDGTWDCVVAVCDPTFQPGGTVPLIPVGVQPGPEGYGIRVYGVGPSKDSGGVSNGNWYTGTGC